MVQAILVAVIAGFTTALLSGVLTPGSIPTALLPLIAPVPLFIAGFGWHPYVAALAGLLASLFVQMVGGTSAALPIAFLFALPTFFVTFMAERLFVPLAGRPMRDGIETGRLALVLVVYLALVLVISGLLIEPDYAALEQRIRRAVMALMQLINAQSGAPQLPPAEQARMVDLLTMVVLPLSGLATLATLFISTALGLLVADRSGRLIFIRPDFRRFRLPGGSLILLGIALIASMRVGYVGLLGSMVALGLVLALVLQGLAVVHVRTLGMDARGLLLTAIWAATIVFGIPAVVFLLIGMLDHLADFRRGRI